MRRVEKGLAGLEWCWVGATGASLPQTPLKKLPLGGLLSQGPELEEDIPDPEELDWWSKYYASLQELQGQVGQGGSQGGSWKVNSKNDLAGEVVPTCNCSYMGG